jgi:alkylated DNA repair dioxygenase AlkB
MTAAVETIELKDGILHYWRNALEPSLCRDALAWLQNEAAWSELTFMNQSIRRRGLYCADPGVDYRYTGITWRGTGWSPMLERVRNAIQDLSGYYFNSCLGHRYPDGQARITWHLDLEDVAERDPVVGSVSLGATRRFLLKHNSTAEKHELPLEHNTLLVMAGPLQHHWQHSVPKTSRPVGKRFNLTFRLLRQTRPT